MIPPLLLIATSYAPPSGWMIAWHLTIDVIVPIALVRLCDAAWFGGLERTRRQRLKVLWITYAALYVLALGRADPEGIARLAASLLAFHATLLGARLLPPRLLASRWLAAATVLALGLPATYLLTGLVHRHIGPFWQPQYDQIGISAAFLWGLSASFLVGLPLVLARRVPRRPVAWPLLEAALVAFPPVHAAILFALEGSRSIHVEYALLPMLYHLVWTWPIATVGGYALACFRVADNLAGSGHPVGDHLKTITAAVVALAGAVMCFLYVWYLAPPLWTPSRGLW